MGVTGTGTQANLRSRERRGPVRAGDPHPSPPPAPGPPRAAAAVRQTTRGQEALGETHRSHPPATSPPRPPSPPPAHGWRCARERLKLVARNRPSPKARPPLSIALGRAFSCRQPQRAARPSRQRGRWARSRAKHQCTASECRSLGEAQGGHRRSAARRPRRGP